MENCLHQLTSNSSVSGPLCFAFSIMTVWTISRLFRNRPTISSRTLSTIARKPSSMNLNGTPPVAKKIPTNIYFGVNPNNRDEHRGPPDEVMDPPVVRVDPYYWLRDESRKDPTVLAHLNAENEYTAQTMAPLKDFQNVLYDEMLRHLKETDSDVPYRHGEFMYYSRTEKGKSYKIHCRRPILSSCTSTAAIQQPELGPEKVVLDENAIAAGHDYSDLQSWCPSPSHNMIAYAVDNSGYETYTIRIVSDVSSAGQERLLEDTIEGSCGTIVWGGDDSVVFYLTMDDEHRPYKLHMHVLGTPQSEDTCLLTELDQMFWMGAGKSNDDAFLIVESGSKETSECHVLDLRDLVGGQAHCTAVSQNLLRCVRTRQFGVRYDVEHHDEWFYCVANTDGAKNNKLIRCSAQQILRQEQQPQWADVRKYHEKEQISRIIPFKNHIAVFGRADGMKQLWVVVPIATSHTSSVSDSSVTETWRRVSFPEDAYSLWAGDNYDFNSNVIRLGYSSLVTPKQVIDYDMNSDTKTVLKQQEVPGYDPKQYESVRLFAPSEDGTRQIPLSLVFNKHIRGSSIASNYSHEANVSDPDPSQGCRETVQASNAVDVSDIRHQPVLLYGYGSYGACMDPSFDYRRSVLLDRGVVYCIAHIRGGGEMGRAVWYEDEGKYLAKLNTFKDFGVCASHLIAEGITTADQMCCLGRSAGGLLVGAAVNMYPHLFKAAVADVPFVDVINTMTDPTIPLTVTEWEEWGNPNIKKYYDYMLQYSPYDNVSANKQYPAMLVTAGLNDPRVAYWEPAKWVAKLRDIKMRQQRNNFGSISITASASATVANVGQHRSSFTSLESSSSISPLLLKTDMSSGHFSASDRYKHIREMAFEYAFILDQVGAKDRLY